MKRFDLRKARPFTYIVFGYLVVSYGELQGWSMLQVCFWGIAPVLCDLILEET